MSSPDDQPKPAVKSNVASFDRLAQLIVAFYLPAFKRPKIKKADVSAMRGQPPLSLHEREELVAVAASDSNLERTRELMLTSLEKFRDTSLAGQTRDVVREVLRRHPAFQAEALRNVFERDGSVDDQNELFRLLSERNTTAMRSSEGSQPLKKADATKRAANTFACLVLWLCDVKALPLARVRFLLHEYQWRPAAKAVKSETQRLRKLLASRDHVTLFIAGAIVQEDVQEWRQAAATAQKREAIATTRAMQADERAGQLLTDLAAVRSQLEQLRVDISKLQVSHDADKAHLNDAFEALKARIVKRLSNEVELLGDGLHALRKDPPLTLVMVDHAERVIAGLTEELTQLKGAHS